MYPGYQYNGTPACDPNDLGENPTCVRCGEPAVVPGYVLPYHPDRVTDVCVTHALAEGFCIICGLREPGTWHPDGQCVACAQMARGYLKRAPEAGEVW